MDICTLVLSLLLAVGETVHTLLGCRIRTLVSLFGVADVRVL
jgi:hypothetical protein